MRFIIRRPHIARSIAIFLAWGAMLGIIVNPWMDGYHGIGGSLWGVSGYVSALVSAFAFLSHRERKDTANSVIAVSSRRAILARYFIADMLTLNIIPFLAVSAATMIGSSVLAGRGYIVWEYFFLIPVFLTLAIFIGWICAHLFTHIPLGLLTSGLLTLFISFYAIQSNTETNAWIQFDNKAFGVLSILILSAVAGFAFVWRLSPRRLAHAAGWVALTTMAGFVWFAGYVDLTIKPRTADITPACTDIGPDIICVWPEDSYKLPILAEQATRIRSLASRAGIDAEPIAFSEPNIPAIFNNLSADGKYDDDYSVQIIQPFGASIHSWAGARGLVIPELLDCDMTASGLSDAELSSQYFVIFDLVTNWVYGDIGYDEFFSSDEETDSERADLGQQLAELSEEEQLNALTHIVRRYHDTCEVHIK